VAARCTRDTFKTRSGPKPRLTRVIPSSRLRIRLTPMRPFGVCLIMFKAA